MTGIQGPQIKQCRGRVANADSRQLAVADDFVETSTGWDPSPRKTLQAWSIRVLLDLDTDHL